MDTKIVKEGIMLDELRTLAHEQYGDLIKVVVDVAQGIMGVGGELHIDIQSILIEKAGSGGNTTWGINLYLNKTGDDFVEFDSMVNLKPLIGNRTRGVEDDAVRIAIRDIVARLIR